MHETTAMRGTMHVGLDKTDSPNRQAAPCIPEILEVLHNEIHNLARTKNQLQDFLEPVLMPDRPQEACDSPKSPFQHSVVGQSIHDAFSNLRSIRIDIDNIIQRLQLAK